jgi:hypothetical protein
VAHELFAVIEKCALPSKLKQILMRDGYRWSSRKPLKSREILHRMHFRQSPPRRTPRASSAAQPLDPPAETARVHTSVAFLCHPAQIDTQMRDDNADARSGHDPIRASAGQVRAHALFDAALP